MIIITLTPQQAQNLAGLLDAGVRQVGLKGAGVAHELAMLIENAIIASQNPTKQEESKDVGVPVTN